MGAARQPETPALDDLASAVGRGEEGALAAWYRREHPEVHRLCFGFLADPAEAEDVAQDAMLHLADQLEQRSAVRAYRAWRNTLVLNLCRDRLRRVAARRGVERAAAERSLPEHLPDPSGEAERGEVREALAAALGRLSPREREAFVLRDLEQAETRDIAAAMGVTEGTVRTLVTLARRRLRGLLSERVPGIVPGGGEA